MNLHAPAPPTSEPDDFDVWDDEDRGCWITNFPPPIGFDGVEYGAWEDDDYCRTLSPEEQAVIDEGIAVVRAAGTAERDAELAAARSARDRAFGFVPASERDGEAGDESGDAAIPTRRSGESRNPTSFAAGEPSTAGTEEQRDPGFRRADEQEDDSS